ncbi:MAG: type 1 glutamine amidotransferase [Pseudomonadota bacterium]
MRIGILLAGHTPPPLIDSRGDFDQMFATLLAGQGFTFRAWDVEAMDFPDSPDDADAWLIPGSRHGAYEDHAFIAPLEDFIRAIHAAGKRMVGICFGHQIIAQALGGQVEKVAHGWAVGRHEYNLSNGQKLSLNAWHQDQVTSLPQGAQVAASSPHCPNAALVYGDAILTLQPHPEFPSDLMRDYADLRRGTVPDALLDEAKRNASDALTQDRDWAAQTIGRFLRDGRFDHAI